MEAEKDNSSQQQGLPQSFPLEEAVLQRSAYVTLKEFQKHGIKKLKVITQKDLEELINLAVEELAGKLDREREDRIALEEEVSKLRKELETANRADGPGPTRLRGNWQEKLKEMLSSILKEAREDPAVKDLPLEFVRKLEETLLKGLEEGLETHAPGTYSEQPKTGQEVKPITKSGGFFDSILKENLQLRESTKGRSSA